MYPLLYSVALQSPHGRKVNRIWPQDKVPDDWGNRSIKADPGRTESKPVPDLARTLPHKPADRNERISRGKSVLQLQNIPVSPLRDRKPVNLPDSQSTQELRRVLFLLDWTHRKACTTQIGQQLEPAKYSYFLKITDGRMGLARNKSKVFEESPSQLEESNVKVDKKYA